MTFTEWVQIRLNAYGANIEVDGAYGPETRKAILEFQDRFQLARNGRADEATVELLRRLSTGPTPSTVPVPPVMPPWLEEMSRRMGLHEKKDNATLTAWLRAGRLLGDPAKAPWCGDAVETCFARTLPDELLPANPFWAQAWADFGWSVSVRVGAVGVIRWSPTAGHVGFVIDWDATRIKLRGGNQSNAIRDAWFPRKRFIAFRWPKTFPVSDFPRITGTALSNAGTR